MKEILGVTLYSVKDVAELLNLSGDTVRKYIKSGALPSRKIGGRFMVSEGNLKDFLNCATQPKENQVQRN